MEKVSIVVPVYNMGDKIENCVQSLLAQTYPELEILLVDDGSKDDSLARCRRLEEKDGRIKVFHKENGGSGPARNYGIERASGAYLYFPDADDFLDPRAIEILVKAAEKNGADLVVFGFQSLLPDGSLKEQKKYTEMVKSAEEIRMDYGDYMTTMSPYGIQGAPWNKFFSKEVIDRYEIRYPALRRHQDEGFIARYMAHAKKVCFLQDILYTYYSNDLGREWDKYPVDYILAVTGLYEERKTNILIWNKEDSKTHEMVYREYLCNVIKALELSFSPKYGFDPKARKAWMKKTMEECEVRKVPVPSCMGHYQRMVCRMMKEKQYSRVYLILWGKVWMEKSGLVHRMKRLGMNRPSERGGKRD